MSTLRAGSRRDYDLDFSGLEESTVDSDDEDISSVNTEVNDEFNLCTWTRTLKKKTILHRPRSVAR